MFYRNEYILSKKKSKIGCVCCCIVINFIKENIILIKKIKLGCLF